jgi:hypothetical protein
MEALDGVPDAVRRSRSRSPDAAQRPSTTTPVDGTGCEQSAVTPSSDADNALAKSSCKACQSATKRLKHTCTKAKHTGKRHASPSVVARHAKRSGTAPTPTLEQAEATEVDGDVGMAATLQVSLITVESPATPSDGDTLALDTHGANDVLDHLDLAPRDEDVPTPLPSPFPSAEENDLLLLPPEGSFICVSLRDGVLPPEIHVFTNIGAYMMADTKAEAGEGSTEPLVPAVSLAVSSWACERCTLLNEVTRSD